jgi:hypothetical protein
MPRGREYRNFHISRHVTDKPEQAEAVHLVTEYMAEDFTIPRVQVAGAEARLDVRNDLALQVRVASHGKTTQGPRLMTWLRRYRVRHYLGNSIWVLPA